jgi:translation initiation factor 2B subunit (eIF-2B alpha/beta/delta family)
VAGLWRAYEGVRPTVADVRGDTDHGAAWLSLRAMEVLRDEAALAAEGETDGIEELAGLARELIAARPSMTVVENRINRVLASASETAADDAALTPAAIESAAVAGIEAAVTADEEAAAIAAETVAADRICTLSRSGTVRAAIARIDPAAVLVAASHPGGEGVAVAEELATACDVTLTSDAALASGIDRWDADAVLVGADTVLPDGSVLNKVGTRAAALSAAHEGIPCYAVASVDKVAAEVDVRVETASEPIYEGDAPVTVANPLFEVVPADCLDGVCTEEGLLDGEDIGEVARRHGERREW